MSLDLLALRQTVAGELQSRFQVTPTGPVSASVEVASGVVFSNQTHLPYEGAAATVGPFSAAPVGQIRWDLVYFDTSSLSYVIVQGSPVSGASVGITGQPTLTDQNHVPLAYIKITESGVVLVSQTDIIDARPFIVDGNLRLRYALGTGNFILKATELYHVQAVTGNWTATQNSSLATLLDELGSRMAAAEVQTAQVPGIQVTLAAKPDNFLELADTPGSYVARGIPAVNDTPNGIDLVSPSVARRDSVRLRDGAVTCFSDFRPETWLAPGATFSGTHLIHDSYAGCIHTFSEDNAILRYLESLADNSAVVDYGVITANTAIDGYPDREGVYQMVNGANAGTFNQYDLIMVGMRVLADPAQLVTGRQCAAGLGIPDGTGGFSDEGVWLRSNGLGDWYLDYATGGTTVSTAITSIALGDNDWHYVTIKLVRTSASPYDKFRIRLYIDGVEATETSGSTIYHSRLAGDPSTDGTHPPLLRPFAIFSGNLGSFYLGALGVHYSMQSDLVLDPATLFNDGSTGSSEPWRS